MTELRHRTNSGIWMAVAAYTAWGLLSPVAKILLDTWPPMAMNAVRSVLATVIVVALVPAHSRRTALEYLRRKEVVLLALLGAGINFTIYLYAITRLDATFATLGFYSAPLWTALLGAVWLRERVGWAFVPAVAALFGGAWLMLTGRGGVPLAGYDHSGMFLAVLSGLGWAAYTVGLRRYAPDLRLRPLVVASFIVSSVYFVAGALLVDGGLAMRQSGEQWAWMGLHALVPTALAILLFNASLQRAPAAWVNILVGVELAATMVFAWWLLGDRFDDVQFLGMVVVLAAVSGYLWWQTRARGEQGQASGLVADGESE